MPASALLVDPDSWYQHGVAPGKVDQYCAVNVPLHSPGIWVLDDFSGLLTFSLTRLNLQLALIFLVTQALHLLLKRCYFPRGIAELVAGMVLGKTFLGKLNPSIVETLFPEHGDVFLEVLSKLGFILFNFLVGVKMDASSVTKAGGKGLSIALAVTFIPSLWSLLLNYTYQIQFPVYRRPTISAYLGTNTIIPFPVIACLLIDLRIMNSELGRIALASSLISNLLTTSFTTVLSLWRLKTVGWRPMVAYQASFLSLVGGFLFMIVMRRLALWIIQRTPEGKPVKGSYVVLMALAACMSSILGENVGLQFHVLPFVLGIFLPDGPPLGSTLVERLDTLVSGMFTPLMMTFCVLKLDLWRFYDLQFIGLLWKIVFSLTGVKFASVFVPALLCKLPVKDAAALSAVMSVQGIVEIAEYRMNFRNQTLDQDSFKTAVLSILVLSAAATIFVKLVYNYSATYRVYQKRDILHTALHAELRILTCAHRQEDVLAAVKLLELSAPTKVSPIAAYALNLVELVGRASPLLINHRLNKNSSSTSALAKRSQQMIDVFQNFENRCSGSLGFQAFTSVSLPRFMHHDICSLAFDKLCSLIVLPFHRKWNSQGQVIFDSNVLRTINRNVLEMSPCSVAVLVDRRKIRPDPGADRSVYNIGVIFMGGDDDREALAYAKRMTQCRGVHLTVVRFLPAEGVAGDQWDTVLDTEALKEVRMMSLHSGNVDYKEERVKDGPETALIINAMEESYDLIVAGRRHRGDSVLLAGITEWSELPELGVVGDILASSDIKRPVSVLIVQQQIIRGQAKAKSN